MTARGSDRREDLRPLSARDPSSEAQPQERATQRIRFLDSLRGLAALVVLLHHAVTLFPRTLAVSAQNRAAGYVLLAQVSRFNTEAVLLFFVLSGFSIRLSIASRGLADAGALAHYVERRLTRILPLYWLSLLLSFLVAALVAPVPQVLLSYATLLGNLLFLQTAAGVEGLWFLPYAGNGALWSLSFEVFYYAAFPLLFRAITERRARLLAVTLATALGQLMGAWWPSPLTLFLGASFIWYVGVELAELYLFRRAAVYWPWLLALTLSLGMTQLGSRALSFYGLWVGSSLLLAGSVLIQHAAQLRPLAVILERPLSVLARVGDFSYALYLLHVPVLRAARTLWGDRPIAVGFAIVISLVLAFAAERAALRLLRRATSARSRVSPASYTAPVQ